MNILISLTFIVFSLINGFESPPAFQETAAAGGIQSAIVSFVSKGNPNVSRPPSGFVGTVRLSAHDSSNNRSSSTEPSKQIGTSSSATSPLLPASRKPSHVVQQYASANRISGIKMSMKNYASEDVSQRRSKVITPTDMPGAIPVAVSTPVTTSFNTPVTTSFKIAPISEDALHPFKNSPNEN